MSLSLDNIKSKAKRKTVKRVGRGNSSGTGTYSTRGQKGQKARAGVSGLKLLGMAQQWRKVPKLRGFKSPNAKNQVIKTDQINATFKDGEKITPEVLKEKGLIKKINLPIKILRGKEKVSVKNLEIDKSIKTSKEVASQLK